ncbi:hypothetical protein HY632_03165 [Candidatus Uhrbacteria bacterium]|nr:hypothetical protein [Candidatus Uhrbacteria bacterium]
MAPGIGAGAPERPPETQERSPLVHYLDAVLIDLRIAFQQSAAPERSTIVQEHAADYALYTLRLMLDAHPMLRQHLEQQGALGADGGWHLESPFFADLVEKVADTIPARMGGTSNIAEFAKAVRWDIFERIHAFRHPSAWS